MKLDMFNIDEFVELNHCPQVTNNVFFQANRIPTPDGLLSYELFGYTEDSRKNIFGYIDLQDWYIHPVVYSMLSARLGSVKYIIQGKKSAIVDPVTKKIKIVPDDTPGAGNGIQFIYDNFEKIDWMNEMDEAEVESIDKKTRLKFLKSLKKDEFFVRKWLVIPPYYREESADSKTIGDDINNLYKNLIATTRAMKYGNEVFGDATRMKIQDSIMELYKITMGPITGKSFDSKTKEMRGVSKNSLLKRNLIGKTISHGALTVITAPVISDSSDMHNIPVPYGYCGVTLISAMALFKPFVVHEASNLLQDILRKFMMEYKKEIYKIDRNQFSPDVIDKLVNRFVKSSNERFDNLTIDFIDKDGDEAEYVIQMDEVVDGVRVRRKMTYMDLFYLSTYIATENKHVVVTRQPVTNNKNIYPARVKLLSTAKTRKSTIVLDMNTEVNNGMLFDNYPYIYDVENPSNNKAKSYYAVIGTTILGNAVIKAMGADYDGDTVFLRGLFSLQANQEAERIIYDKSSILGPDGAVIRGLDKIGKDCVVTLYCLTKD